jgi:hypothetical protein
VSSVASSSELGSTVFSVIGRSPIWGAADLALNSAASMQL